MKEIIRANIKYVIKTFLVCNKGKKYTGNEISKFITVNNFCNNRTDIPSGEVTRMIKKDYQGILKDVKFEKVSGKHYFWVE